MRSVAQKLGIGTTETVRKSVRRAEVDAGARPGVTSDESAELRRLKALPETDWSTVNRDWTSAPPLTRGDGTGSGTPSGPVTVGRIVRSQQASPEARNGVSTLL
jgi:hypothetical protein